MRLCTALIIYITLVSAISVFLTVKDKSAAKKGKWRVRESTLMLFGFLGGALCMFVCMKLIHHKTLKAKFMVGLPLFFALHIILAAAAVYLSSTGVFSI